MRKKILIVATELAGVAFVGGIAEYVLGLATSLLKRGHDVRVTIPLYSYLQSHPGIKKIKNRLPIKLGVGVSEVTPVYELLLDCPGDDQIKLPIILLGKHKHFDTVYSENEIYAWPNHEPWIIFSRAVVDFITSDEWKPDIIHCQDSHCALIPVYIKHIRKNEKERTFALSTKTILTIHNLLNQGLGFPELVSFAGLPEELYNKEMFEYYNSANCLRAGILSADKVNTVSQTYANEITLGNEYGFGLEDVFLSLKKDGKLKGIANGINENRWRMVYLKYDGSKDDIHVLLENKKNYRKALFTKWNWKESDKPILAFRGRWDSQKGVELLTDCMEELIPLARIVFVTWGYSGNQYLINVWKKLNKIAEAYRDDVLINPIELNALEKTGDHYLIADFLLMPSKYEPCGLAQMECQRYGTIPIVRKVGGLADTVSELKSSKYPSPNGFVFEKLNSESLVNAVQRAVKTYNNSDKMKELIMNALLQKNSWDNRAEEYESLYGI